MHCDTDNDTTTQLNQLNWLELKKAQEARTMSSRASDREKLEQEHDQFLKEPNGDEKIRSNP